MDSIEAASAFLGMGGRSGMHDSTMPSETHTITGTATSDSADGTVRVDLEGYTVSADGEQSLELPTTVDVKEGDVVQVTLVGGTGKSPIVTGVVGGGDRLSNNVQDAVQTAQDAADAVAEVADVKKYFFHDDDGAHVTTEPDDATTGPNTLIDSGGFYVRDGTTVKAQFTDPVIVGETGSGKANIRIGNIPNWSNGLGLFNGSSIDMMLAGNNGGGLINSSQGAYIILSDGVGVNTYGGTPFNVLDVNRQSGFTIGGYHIYVGTIVQTVQARSYHRVWTNAVFKSTFHVKTESAVGVCYVQFANGDAAVQPKQLNASYKDSSGWFMGVDGTLGAGAFRINYLVVVPDSESTV